MKPTTELNIMDEENKPTKAPKEKQPKVSTAKRIKDLNTYAGDVGLFELSKQIKKGSIGTKYVVIARFKPRSGLKNTTVWMANEQGAITMSEPIKEFRSESMGEAVTEIGYKLI